MIRCLVVDDEQYAANIVADYIAKTPNLSLAGITTSAIEALSIVKGGEIDVIFLDIQMPDLTGIQFLKLYNNACKVILTTAYPEFAIDGFEHSVVDYLLKPIAFDRFLKAIQKLEPSMLDVSTSKPHQQEYLFVKGDSKNKFIKINYNDIYCIEGSKNYVAIYTKDRKLLTYQSLTELEGQLPQPPFYRVHRSYIISIDHISMINGNIIHLYDQQIPLSDTYKASFYNIVRDKKQ